MLYPFKKLNNAAVSGKEIVSDFDFKKGYPDVNQNMSWANIEPYARQAIRSYILPLVGRDLYDDICGKIANPPQSGWSGSASEEFAELLRDVAAHYTVMVMLPKKKTIVSSMGAVENQATEGTTASSLWGFKTTLWAVAQDADRMMDELMAFIEKKSDAAPFSTLWKNQPVADQGAAVFFRNVSDFQEYHPIARSLRTFLQLRPIINEEAERQVLPILQRAQYDALAAAVKAGNATDKQKALLHYVRKSVAKWAVYQATMTLPVLPDQDGFRVISNVDAIDQKAYSQEVITNAIQGIREAAERSAKTATADLWAFLRQKIDDYPLWAAAQPDQVTVSWAIEGRKRGGVWL